MNLIKFQINECTAEPGTWDVTAFKGQITVLYRTVQYAPITVTPQGFVDRGILAKACLSLKQDEKRLKGYLRG